MDGPNWDFWTNARNAFAVNALQIVSAVFFFFFCKANEPSPFPSLTPILLHGLKPLGPQLLASFNSFFPFAVS